MQNNKTIYWGISLLILLVLVFFIRPLIINDKVVQYFSFAIYGVLRVGGLFHGQTRVKKLNRNYKNWSATLFLFTSVSLIVLGFLKKIEKPITVIKLEPGKSSLNPNQLPAITIATESALLLESQSNSTFTLKHMLKNYKDYLKDNTSLFPILTAYELNKRNEEFDNDIKQVLEKFSREKGYSSFYKLLEKLNEFLPEEINEKFKI